MRIDLALKYLCIVKSRSMAKSLCDQGRVILRGAPARSSSAVRPGDRVTVHLDGHSVTVTLDEIPEKQLSKASALAYYHSVETPDAEARPAAVDPLEDL